MGPSLSNIIERKDILVCLYRIGNPFFHQYIATLFLSYIGYITSHYDLRETRHADEVAGCSLVCCANLVLHASIIFRRTVI